MLWGMLPCHVSAGGAEAPEGVNDCMLCAAVVRRFVCCGPCLGWLHLLGMSVQAGRQQRRVGRFVCRERLGAGGHSAAFLSPVPADCVVYGSGDAAVILTKVG